MIHSGKEAYEELPIKLKPWSTAVLDMQGKPSRKRWNICATQLRKP